MPSKGLQSLLKEYAAYIKFADEETNPHYFPFGILSLNHIIADNNGKGIEGGSIVQLLAENKRGKSTLALDLLAQAQRTNLTTLDINGRKINAAVLNFEQSYDRHYAARIGVDNSKVWLIDDLYAEDAFNIAESLITNGLQFLLIDSVAMAVPQSESDKTLDESSKVAAEASIIGRFLKRINVILTDQQLVVLVNQYRANMSAMSRSDRKPYGAKIIQYVVKLTIELERIKNEDNRTTVQALVSKTKFGAEGRKITFDIEFGKGIDYNGHTLDLALQFGIVERKAAWYYYGELKANGAENAKENFPMDEIKKQVINYMEKGN
jgi:recombination protein RecA